MIELPELSRSPMDLMTARELSRVLLLLLQDAGVESVPSDEASRPGRELRSMLTCHTDNQRLYRSADSSMRAVYRLAPRAMRHALELVVPEDERLSPGAEARSALTIVYCWRKGLSRELLALNPVLFRGD
jgi:hypothetical protein